MTGRKGPYLMMPRELSVASEHSLCARSWTNSVFFVFLMGCVSLTAETRVCGSDQVVVVCPPEFTNSLSPWVRLRKAQGFEVVVVRPVADAGETKKLVRQAFSNLKRSNSSIPDHSPVGDSIAKRSAESSRFLFLLGDTPPIGAVCDLTRQVPTFYQPADVTAKWGSTPTLPSDFPYSDLDNDGNPDVATGRLPVDSGSQFDAWFARLIARESSSDFPDWRAEVQLVGGVGGFGYLADRTIESVARTIVTGVLPGEVRTHVLYASPGHRFYPANQSFTDAVLEQFSQGCRFWVYAGHGQVTELDRVPASRDGVPVLDRRSTTELSCRPSQSPIALLLACYTGALDAREDSIAEHLLMTQGGPIAVIAGSRITMPYGNATLAVSMIRAIYEDRPERLGRAWLATQRTLLEDGIPESPLRVMIDGLAGLLSPAGSTLAEEREEHVWLYGLLGDPTQVMRHAEEINVDAPPGIELQTPVPLTVTSPLSGEISIRVDRPLGAEFPGDPNETLVLSEKRQVVAGEVISMELNLESEVQGPLIIRAVMRENGRFALGAARTIVRVQSSRP